MLMGIGEVEDQRGSARQQGLEAIDSRECPVRAEALQTLRIPVETTDEFDVREGPQRGGVVIGNKSSADYRDPTHQKLPRHGHVR